ncbi:transposase [Streptomyces sp. NBC_01604]|uniref:transposase n=1 Tax=Streptomyces sp. NBC_01604 TaxID=2975894 RepID=UPI00386D61E7
MPRAADGRIVLAADVSPWLRPDANSCADWSFCHMLGRSEGKHQMVPGWPYSILAALETGRTSWTAVWTRSAWRRRRCGDHRQDPPGRRAARHRRPVEAG